MAGSDWTTESFDPNTANESECWEGLPFLTGPELARVLDRLGGFAFDRADYAQAAALAEQAGTVWREHGHESRAAASYINASSCLTKAGDAPAALPRLLAAADLMEVAGDPQQRGDVIYRLADGYHEIGEIETALEYFPQAAEFAQAAGNSAMEFGINIEWGRALVEVDRFEEAACRFERAHFLAVSDQVVLPAADAVARWGEALFQMGDYAGAVSRLGIALSLPEYRNRLSNFITKALLLAEARLRFGDVESAYTLLAEVVEECDPEDDHRTMSRAQLLQAEAGFILGQREELLERLAELEGSFAVVADGTSLVRLHELLARINSDLGRHALAEVEASTLREIAEAVESDADDLRRVAALSVLVAARGHFAHESGRLTAELEFELQELDPTQFEGDTWLVHGLELAKLAADYRAVEGGAGLGLAGIALSYLDREVIEPDAYTGRDRAELQLLAAQCLAWEPDADIAGVLLAAMVGFVDADDFDGVQRCREVARRLMPNTVVPD